MYISRHAESTVKKLASMFGAVLVAGPRQVGKTTMLKSLTNGINYVTMDEIKTASLIQFNFPSLRGVA